MSLCDQCPDPGMCCRSIRLFTVSADSNRWEFTVWENDDARQRLLERSIEPLPFWPLRERDRWRDEDEERDYLAFEWGCPHLSDCGRCNIYAERPILCDSFEAASSPACIFYDMQVAMDEAFAKANP